MDWKYNSSWLSNLDKCWVPRWERLDVRPPLFIPNAVIVEVSVNAAFVGVPYAIIVCIAIDSAPVGVPYTVIVMIAIDPSLIGVPDTVIIGITMTPPLSKLPDSVVVNVTVYPPQFLGISTSHAQYQTRHD